jgi:NAD(P)-dependent dehydrogenase (short-subunit alcohol dehydrogenase family)
LNSFPKSSHHLHLAFAVPGILYPEKSPSQISAENALLTFQTNTLGPLLLMKHFHRFLPTKAAQLPHKEIPAEAESRWQGLSPSNAVFAMMSARVGSITDNHLGGWYSYRASKAGVNQIVKTFDNHLRTSSGDNAFSVGLHPGTVKTALSKEFWATVKEDKLFDADWVAKRLVGLCTGEIGIAGRGRCWDWDGKVIAP